MSKKFEVLLSTTYGEWVKVEADNYDEALEKVKESDLCREVVCKEG